MMTVLLKRTVILISIYIYQFRRVSLFYIFGFSSLFTVYTGQPRLWPQETKVECGVCCVGARAGDWLSDTDITGDPENTERAGQRRHSTSTQNRQTGNKYE